MNVDAMIAAARKRIHKQIDLRIALATSGKPATFCRRSVGQKHRIRKGAK